MAGNFANLRLAPAIVEINGVDLGFTSAANPIEINDADKSVELKAAQFGDSAIDVVITGHTTEVMAPVVEVTPDKLALACPSSEVAGTTVTIRNRVGLQLRSQAVPMRVVRIVGGELST